MPEQNILVQPPSDSTHHRLHSIKYLTEYSKGRILLQTSLLRTETNRLQFLKLPSCPDTRSLPLCSSQQWHQTQHRLCNHRVSKTRSRSRFNVCMDTMKVRDTKNTANNSFGLKQWGQAMTSTPKQGWSEKPCHVSLTIARTLFDVVSPQICGSQFLPPSPREGRWKDTWNPPTGTLEHPFNTKQGLLAATQETTHIPFQKEQTPGNSNITILIFLAMIQHVVGSKEPIHANCISGSFLKTWTRVPVTPAPLRDLVARHESSHLADQNVRKASKTVFKARTEDFSVCTLFQDSPRAFL